MDFIDLKSENRHYSAFRCSGHLNVKCILSPFNTRLIRKQWMEKQPSHHFILDDCS